MLAARKRAKSSLTNSRLLISLILFAEQRWQEHDEQRQQQRQHRLRRGISKTAEQRKP
jgi:hypothetical protein